VDDDWFEESPQLDNALICKDACMMMMMMMIRMMIRQACREGMMAELIGVLQQSVMENFGATNDCRFSGASLLSNYSFAN